MRTVALFALVLTVTVLGHAPPTHAQAGGSASEAERPSRRYASEYGDALSEVDRARKAGEYQRAVNTLSGFLKRWGESSELRMDDMIAIQQQMRHYVELRELLELAAHDSQAAAQFLAKVTQHTDPSARSIEQARALAILARHDWRLEQLLERVFPARVIIAVTAGPQSEEGRVLLNNAIADITRNQPLQLRDDDGAGTLTIKVDMRENDRNNSLLSGTAMRSYAAHVTAELTDADGRALLSVATTTSMLGINIGYAMKTGMSRLADLVFGELMAEIARRVDRGDLP